MHLDTQDTSEERWFVHGPRFCSHPAIGWPIAVVADLDQSGLPYVMRGKDYGLLDLPEIQARLERPPDQVVTHPETATTRAIFDCLDIALTPMGPRIRVIVATHPATSTPARVGTTPEGLVYELFFTCLPPSAFTPSDVLDLYLHRGGFETVLSDEDKEQDFDRWCSYTANGQEFWQILSQWIWNLRASTRPSFASNSHASH